MKNIPLSADESLIEAARERARAERTTLNEEFRRWLAQYAGQKRSAESALAVVKEMRRYVRIGGRKFSRDEVSER